MGRSASDLLDLDWQRTVGAGHDPWGHDGSGSGRGPRLPRRARRRRAGVAARARLRPGHPRVPLARPAAGRRRHGLRRQPLPLRRQRPRQQRRPARAAPGHRRRARRGARQRRRAALLDRPRHPRRRRPRPGRRRGRRPRQRRLVHRRGRLHHGRPLRRRGDTVRGLGGHRRQGRDQGRRGGGEADRQGRRRGSAGRQARSGLHRERRRYGHPDQPGSTRRRIPGCGLPQLADPEVTGDGVHVAQRYPRPRDGAVRSGTPSRVVHERERRSGGRLHRQARAATARTRQARAVGLHPPATHVELGP